MGGSGMVKQLVALGYIDEPDADATKAVTQALQQKYANLAEVYLSTGRFDKAQACLEQQLEFNPENKVALIRLARCRFKQGDLNGCLTIADQIAGENKDSPFAQMLYGQVYAEREQHDLALECFLKAEEAGYELPSVRYRLANIYLRRELWGQAESIARELLTHDDHEARYYHVLGMSLLGQSRYEEASIELMRATSLKFDLASAHVDLAHALVAEEHIEAAIDSLQNALKSTPNYLRAHALLARLYRAKGDIVNSSVHHARSHAKPRNAVTS